MSEDNWKNWEYAGFWIRVGASVIDNILLVLIGGPLLFLIYGEQYAHFDKLINGPADFLISYIFPAVAIIAFWVYKSATPGKMLLRAKILDAKTAKPPSVGQCIGRYFAYILSGIPLGIGFLWVAFDKRKQGWHDKLAGTVVVRLTNPTAEVAFYPQEKSDEHTN